MPEKDQRTIVKNGIPYTVKRRGGIGLLIGREGEQSDTVVAPNADGSEGDPDRIFGYIAHWNRDELPRPERGGMTLEQAVEACIEELEQEREREVRQAPERERRKRLEQKGWLDLDEYIKKE